MNSIHSLQRGQACAFDFIQNVLSNITAEIEKNQKNNLIEIEKLEVAEYYNKMNRNNLAETNARKEIMSKQNNSGTNSNINLNSIKKLDANETAKNQDKKRDGKVSIGVETPVGPIPKPVLAIPEKKWTEIPEYRNAYLQALNEGLSGQTARDRARALLVNVLADVSTIRCDTIHCVIIVGLVMHCIALCCVVL